MIAHAAPDAAPIRIVGIGASAGGLESLGQLFDALPTGTGMCFVVVQHLSPEFRTAMDELLARRTQMPVAFAAHDAPLVADRVYLLPPGKEMIVRGGRLILSDRPPHTFTWPIDTFLRSLAHDAGPRAVAVILSGAGSDGARGLVEIKAAGGYVLAESPDTARFDGMPRAAIETGAVDEVLAAPDLAHHLRYLPPSAAPRHTPDPLVERDLPAVTRDILALLHERFGVDFTQYKTTTVSRRIQRRIDLARIASLPAYLDELRARPDELDALYRDLLIGVTQFFRDPEAFAAIEQVAIPRLLDLVPVGEPIRLWVAGCATGEEVYSLAMLFVEAFAARDRPVALEITASDVHERSLTTAAEARYRAEQLTQVSDARIARFFDARPDGFHVSDEIRRLITFTRHDVTREPPLTQVHMISCRNLLIYLAPPALRSVLAMFHFALVTGGVLFLGSSEMPVVLGDELRPLDDRWRLYEKRPSGPPITAPRDDVRARVSRVLSRREPRRPLVSPTPDPFTLEAYDQLLDWFMPPGFLIGEDRGLIDSFAGAEQLLRARPRRPSANMLELLDEELRLVVARAIDRALDDGARVAYAGVAIVLDGPARATVVARPLAPAPGQPRAVVITFEDVRRDTHAFALSTQPEVQVPRDATRGGVNGPDLPAHPPKGAIRESPLSVDQMIASYEELQSINEQLQSVNEQLTTAQRDLEHDVADWRDHAGDLRDLLDASDVAALVVDRTLHVRVFTARIAPVFRLRATDLGRPLTDFASTLDHPTLIDELTAAIATGTPATADVSDAAGASFRLHIDPRADGAVVRLVPR
ncbi:MAG TPA: chemotaxis protein CheB [Kofleriaceae bacterium]|nr:chemotaxis protein CheB [Kofleriaceae bacterium]